jgi:hypothetical protein
MPLMKRLNVYEAEHKCLLHLLILEAIITPHIYIHDSCAVLREYFFVLIFPSLKSL